ncbi:MAG: recombination protein RecR [Deltaproteobacteria bacterium CG11_big_fil_rev_8_21_14_0_20_49_13]|nr:MAG: recombination protein RecR [Deltaproteobacteria bacterium CG11_big_fil_rev_8_21_14_0_20_49_13]
MNPIEKLIEEFSKLPGVGQKTAARLAYHITRAPKDDAYKLSVAIVEVKDKVHNCPECFNLTENSSCPICNNPNRNKTIVCVVEEPQDALAIEKSGAFNGVYHVLHGSLSPLDGIGPDDIKTKELVERVKKGALKELIVATNPTTTGEATAFYIAKLVRPLNIKLTRIAFGIPFGGDIEYVDRSTLARSIEHRSNI